MRGDARLIARHPSRWMGWPATPTEVAMKLIKEMWNGGWPGRTILGLSVFFVLLIPAMIYSSIKEAEDWAAFSAAHACKKVGEISGSTQTGVGFGMTTNGQMGTVVTTSRTPSKTGWLCDDGVTYWR